MPSASTALLALLLALLLAGCDDAVDLTQYPDTYPAEDATCPSIDHDPVVEGNVGQAVPIMATVVDTGRGLADVEVFFQQETATVWDSALLSPHGDGSVYAGEIPAAAVGSAGMNYYLSAADVAGNRCCDPEGGEDDPYHFRVVQ